MTRRPDGLWQQQMTVTVNGKKKQKYFYGHTKAEVYRKISEYEEQQERGRLFETVADEWWEEAEPQLAYNTKKSYVPALRRAKEQFGNLPVRSITTSDISTFIKSFVRENNAADKTARTQLMIINLVLRYAAESGDILINPAREVSIPKNLPKRKRTMPDSEDIRRVKKSVECTFGLFPYMLIYTGCRRSELLALTWDDIDFDARTITINKSIYQENNKPRVKAPKTAAGIRTIPLMNKLYERIKDKKGSGLVFCNQHGAYITEDQYQDLWAAFASESHVTCTAHQLRHAYATMLFEAGIDPKDAQLLLGHAQLSTTMDIYTEIRESRRKAVAAKLIDVDIN